MAKDLTSSDIHRKNVLNNKYALKEIETEVAFPGILFESFYRYTKKQIADFYDIDLRTVERYLVQHEAEFSSNGYEVLSGARLKMFKEAYDQYAKASNIIPIDRDDTDINVGMMDKDDTDIDVGMMGKDDTDIDVGMMGKDDTDIDVGMMDKDDTDIDVGMMGKDDTDIDVGMMDKDDTDINVGIISKAARLGVFDFRAFLNLGMLLTESERAKQLRSLILDIVIDTLNAKLGGSTKFINQREEDFLPSAIREYNYEKVFFDALDECIKPSKWKYSQFTDAVFKSIFNENAKEYKQVLKLKPNDSAKSTMYSEVLNLIAAFENGFADYLKKKYKDLGRKLSMQEARHLFSEFESSNSAFQQPLLENSKKIMASRDMAFRDAFHEKLKNYITHLSPEEYVKFLGERSMALEDHLKENIDVFKRLKDR